MTTTIQRFRDSWNERVAAAEFDPTFTIGDLVFQDTPNGPTAFADFRPTTFFLWVVANEEDELTMASLKVDEAPDDSPALETVLQGLMLVFVGAVNPTLSGEQQLSVLGELRITDPERRTMKEIEGRVSRGEVTYSATVTQRAPRWSTTVLTATFGRTQ